MVIMKKFCNYLFLFYRSNQLEVTDEELKTPLLMAAALGNTEIMAILIEKGAKLTCTDGKGNSILHLMASNNNVEVLKVSGLT